MDANKTEEKVQSFNPYFFFDHIGDKISTEVAKEMDAMAHSRALRILVWNRVLTIVSNNSITTQEEAAHAFYQIQGIMSLNKAQ